MVHVRLDTAVREKYCLANSWCFLAIHKSGSCPSGYSSSGNYCVAQAETRTSALTPTTVTKNGSCPSGYSSSVIIVNPNSGARFAIEKNGSCPSGYSSSGEYCLANAGAKFAIHKRWFMSIWVQQFR